MSSRHGLEIRAAAPADAAGVSALLAASGHAVPAPTVAARLERIQRAPGAALLALEWGPPSGLIVLHWYPTLEADHPVAEITTLLVGPDERRRGLARLLVKAASQAARSAGCHDIGIVAAGQPGLQAFCAATGFIEDGGRLRRALRRSSKQAVLF